MSLLDARPVYKPFKYPWAYDAWLNSKDCIDAQEVPMQMMSQINAKQTERIFS